MNVFSFISSSSEVEAFKTKIVPKNTDKATQWAVSSSLSFVP